MKNIPLCLITIIILLVICFYFQIKLSEAKKELQLHKNQAQSLYQNYEEEKIDGRQKDSNINAVEEFNTVRALVETKKYSEAIKLICHKSFEACRKAEISSSVSAGYSEKTIEEEYQSYEKTSDSNLNKLIFYCNYFNQADDIKLKSLILSQLGDVYYELNLKGKAVLCYRKAFEYNPEDKLSISKYEKIFTINIANDIIDEQRQNVLPDSSAWVKKRDYDPEYPDDSERIECLLQVSNYGSEVLMTWMGNYAQIYNCGQKGNVLLFYYNNSIGSLSTNLTSLGSPSDLDRIIINKIGIKTSDQKLQIIRLEYFGYGCDEKLELTRDDGWFDTWG